MSEGNPMARSLRPVVISQIRRAFGVVLMLMIIAVLGPAFLGSAKVYASIRP